MRRDEELEPSLSEDGLTYTLEIRDVKAREAGGYDISVGDLRATRTLLVGRKSHRETVRKEGT